MIRYAKMSDIPAIVGIMCIALEEANFSKNIKIDKKEAKSIIFQSIGRHGGEKEGSTFCVVAVKDDKVVGYLIAVLQRFHGITDVLEATDWQWYCTKDVHARDPLKMVRAMHKWAAKSPKCVAIIQANNDIWANPEAVTRSLEGLGMKRCGHVLRKEITR